MNVIEQNLMKQNTNFTVCEFKRDEKLVCLFIGHLLMLSKPDKSVTRHYMPHNCGTIVPYRYFQ